MPTTTGLTIPFTGLKKQYHALRSEILDATDEVLRSGVLMNGNHTAEFESWLARRNKVKYAITCHSGTHALEILAQYWADKLNTLHPHVLIPSFTYVATANAFVRAGWDVTFVDTDAYGIFDDNKIPNNNGYEAVVLVGLYGHQVTHTSQVRTWSWWLSNNVVVLEDAAQHWLSADCQRIGKGSALSFDPMKNLANQGNGGAVVTDDLDLAEYARSWRDAGKPNFSTTGTNSRMSELDCATLMIKARHLDRWQARRAAIANFWCDRFKSAPVRTLIDAKNNHNHACHKFVIDIDRRDLVKQSLAERKIETRVHYEHPLHELPTFRNCAGPGLMAVSSSLARRVLSLPLYPELTDLEVEYISDQVLALV